MPSRFVLRLLGASELEGPDGPLAWPSRRALALVACLAIDGEASRAALADRLWPALDTGAARRNLRRELARLRDAGLGDAFDGVGERVALAATVDNDVQRFAAACSRGDSASAIALWRGVPLDGLTLADAEAFDAWLAERREALRRRWQQAVLAHATKLESTGAVREALRLQLRLHADEPLYEQPVFDAMRLHHLLGEHTAALDLHARWSKEGGQAPQPGARIAALAERIRAAQRLKPLFGRSDRGGRPPALDAPLIARDAESDRVGSSTCAFLLVEGEAGVGKTRLVQESLRVPRTLALRCDAAARHAPLHPWTEALRAALDSPARAARLADLPARDRQEAARLLPGLAPGTVPSAAAAPERERFFDALAEVIDRLAGDGGVVWIDDLHWADDATLALLSHLALRHGGRTAEHHVRIVAAARGEELHATAAGELVRRLDRAGVLERLVLSPFDAVQTGELLEALAGRSPGSAFAERLARATSGNPFHLLETLRVLFDAGDLRVGADGAWIGPALANAVGDSIRLPVPPTVAEAVIERVEHLGVAVGRLLEAASLARSGFTMAEVRPATSLDEWKAVDALEAALDARLLAQVAEGDDGALSPARTPGYRFAHDLIREAVAQRLRPERRRLLHDRLAQALIEQGQAPDRIAGHLEQAGHGAQAVPWRMQAAEQARALFAWREALEHLERAWTWAEDAAAKLQIVRERVAAAWASFDLPALRRASDELQRLADDDPALDLEAAVVRGELGQLSKQALGVVGPLRDAITRTGNAPDPTLRTRAVVTLANLLLLLGRVDDAEHAIAAIDADDERVALHMRAAALATHANAARIANDHARAHDRLAAAISLLHASENLGPRLQYENLIAHTQYELGRPADALATLERVLAEAERAGLTVVLRTVLPNLVTLCTLEGQYDRAREYVERGMHALRTVDNPAAHAALYTHLAELELLRGDLGAALAAARTSIERYDANGGGSQDGAPWLMCALIHASAGDDAGAVAVFDALERSPARLPGAAGDAIVRFRRACLRIAPATACEAAMLADELAAMRLAPEGVYLPGEADYWRARALLRAGHIDLAREIAESLPLNLAGLLLHAASLLALRLDAGEGHTASNDRSLIDAAQAALDGAPALASLELGAALVRALRRRCDDDGALRVEAWLDARVAALSATLQSHPDLAAGMRRQWSVGVSLEPPSKARGGR